MRRISIFYTELEADFTLTGLEFTNNNLQGSDEMGIFYLASVSALVFADNLVTDNEGYLNLLTLVGEFSETTTFSNFTFERNDIYGFEINSIFLFKGDLDIILSSFVIRENYFTISSFYKQTSGSTEMKNLECTSNTM